LHHRGLGFGSEIRPQVGGSQKLDAEAHGAEAQLLPVPENGIGHSMAVDEGPVGAALIHDGPGCASTLDAGVAAGDGAVVQDDVATRVAADDDVLLYDLERTAGRRDETQRRQAAAILAWRPSHAV
jgi:hypothetical protein